MFRYGLNEETTLSICQVKNALWFHLLPEMSEERAEAFYSGLTGVFLSLLLPWGEVFPPRSICWKAVLLPGHCPVLGDPGPTHA